MYTSKKIRQKETLTYSRTQTEKRQKEVVIKEGKGNK
jgi:hypothetical protein